MVAREEFREEWTPKKIGAGGKANKTESKRSVAVGRKERMGFLFFRMLEQSQNVHVVEGNIWGLCSHQWSEKTNELRPSCHELLQERKKKGLGV